jgi:hypothetical protein
VARSVAERYLVAAFAFMAAATWLGVSLTAAFTCLLVFVLAFQAVRLYQRRSASRSRRSRSARVRRSHHESEVAQDTDISVRAPSTRDRSRSGGRLYDEEREEVGWPVSSEATR